jgi:DNA-binding SARP family transcriptional activator
LLLRIFLLGSFRVERGDLPVPDAAWHRPSGKQLLKLLAVAPEHRLHREQILESLWPDLEPESANASLRKAFHFARHALEPDLPAKAPSSYIQANGEVLALASAVWINSDHFSSLATAALNSGDIAELQAALHAYAGELLPEDRYQDWAAACRNSLDALRQRLMLALVEQMERGGAARSAADYLRQALATDPTQEDVLRRLMKLYARTGMRHAALRQFHVTREALRLELEAEPEPETLAVHEEILAASGGNAVATAAEPIHEPQTLPVPLRHLPTTAFIGRGRALDLLVHGHSRCSSSAIDRAQPGGRDGRLFASIKSKRGCPNRSLPTLGEGMIPPLPALNIQGGLLRP